MAAAAKLHRHIGRRRAARFLAEGPNLVEAALRRDLVVELFATDEAQTRFVDLLDGVAVQPITDKAAKALSDTVTPVGLVAVCRIPDVDLDAVLTARPTLIAVAVRMSEPGNAGTLIRVADAMGADAVVFTGNSVDPYNGKCLRASAGSIFSLPVVTTDDASATVAAIGDCGLQTLATTLDGETDLDAVEASLADPTAWLFGPESSGLPTEVADSATRRVRIPMAGNAESLNVGAAAAICLYESARARRQPRVP